MVLKSEQVAMLIMVVGIAALIFTMLEIHSRLRKAQLLYRASENRNMLLEIEIGRLLKLNKYQSACKDKPAPQQQEGATYELCRRTNQWRVT